MRAAVIVFPGSNCDRDLAIGLRLAGFDVTMVWHKDVELPAGLDVVGVPGGFSFGDYLRCGAIAAKAPIMKAVAEFAQSGGHVLGVCNGFQVLCETGLLPGVLMRNGALKFVCRVQELTVSSDQSVFTQNYKLGQQVSFPVAHHDGNYVIDPDGLARLKGEDRVAFTYVGNPNGSVDDIAGILSENRRVLGMMPHPERAVDPVHGGTDGSELFAGLAAALVAA